MPLDLIALGNAPASLKSRQQWLVWKFEPGATPEAKPRKMPYYASGRRRSGTQGSAADRSLLVTFDAAIAAAQRLKMEGIGFAFLPDDGLIGIDIDGAIDVESGEISERAAAIIAACDSYTEYSPSRKGVHIIVQGSIEASFKSNDIGVEVFCGSQYFTFTGQRWPGAPDDLHVIPDGVIGRLRATVDQAKAKKLSPPAAAAPPSPPRVPGSGDDFKRVNEIAIGALHAWVPALFPGAVARGKGWRVSSKALGRDLQEDLSITPEGIVDFGIADMGDAKQGKRTPIDLVKEWLPASKPRDALTWLARRVGYDLQTAAIRPAGAVKPSPAPQARIHDLPPADDAPPGPPGPSVAHSARKRKQNQGYGADSASAEAPESKNPAESPSGNTFDGAGFWRPAPPDSFHETDKGGVKAVMHNLMLILRDHPVWAGALGFDQYAELIVKLKPPPWQGDRPFKRGGEWMEEDDFRLRHWLSTYFFEAKEKDVMQAVTLIAHAHAFHPLIEKFEATTWDGVHRLRTWLIDYMGVGKGKKFMRLPPAERDIVLQYSELVGMYWMIGAVARVFEAAKPGATTGAKMDTMLILEGEQGLLKSTALRTLGGDYFTDEKLDFGNKDSLMVLQGRHIIEMAEMEGFNKADTSATKYFIPKREDLFRLPYGKKLVKKPRRCVFAGTVNHDVYLKDDSGNRRFWPVWCTDIDIARLEQDVAQLWAEALHWYRDGHRWWPSAEDRHLFTFEQDKRFQEDDWREVVESFCIGKNIITSGEVLGDALKIDKARWDKMSQMRVGSIMRRMGWERRRKLLGGVQVWAYIRPGTDEDDEPTTRQGDDAAF